MGIIREYAREPGDYLGSDMEMYLELMEKSIEAYDFNDISECFGKRIRTFQDIYAGYSRIGMSRLINVMAVLMQKGRLRHEYAFWTGLLDEILLDIEEDFPKSGVEFLVLELCTALLNSNDFIQAEDYKTFIEKLKNINPYKKYDSTLARKKPDELHNFCMYGICAEYLRGKLTGAETSGFIEEHWQVQRNRFDAEGRYRDPGCPMTYDITSRYRMVLMLHFGFEGPIADEMKELLHKGAAGLMLQMSSDFKFPFGGRSNQFQFNESLAASMCEYYHMHFLDLGEIRTAGAFKRCAGMSIRRLEKWFAADPVRHIKNMFPTDSAYGIDSYGTYERYMGTMGTFLTGAVLMHDPDAEQYEAPMEYGGYVYETGEDFHKLFACCCGYSLEIDKDADIKYDATGLGRVQYRNAPCGLALGMPFAKKPAYLLGDYINDRGRSIGACWQTDNGWDYLAEKGKVKHTAINNQSRDEVGFSLDYEIAGQGMIREEYKIDGSGIQIITTCDFTDVSYCIPILKTDGSTCAKVVHRNGCCSVSADGWTYEIRWNSPGRYHFEDNLLYNRNGVYKELIVENDRRTITIKLSVYRSKE